MGARADGRSMRAVVVIAGIGLLSLAAAPPSRDAPLLHQVMTIPLPGVEGRIDHMTLDGAGQRLFVVALGNNSVEVLDLRSGRTVRSLAGFSEPQGVGFVPFPPRLFVSNGGDGSCWVLDAGSFRTLRKVWLADDADNVRVDTAARRVYVGFGSGAIAVLDAASGDSLGRFELPAGFEQQQVRARPCSTRRTGGSIWRCRTGAPNERKSGFSRSRASNTTTPRCGVPEEVPS